MIVSWKHVTRRVSIGLSAFMLMVFLAACGGGRHGLFYSYADTSNSDAQSYHSVNRAADIHGRWLYH